MHTKHEQQNTCVPHTCKKTHGKQCTTHEEHAHNTRHEDTPPAHYTQATNMRTHTQNPSPHQEGGETPGGPRALGGVHSGGWGGGEEKGGEWHPVALEHWEVSTRVAGVRMNEEGRAPGGPRALGGVHPSGRGEKRRRRAKLGGGQRHINMCICMRICTKKYEKGDIMH